MTGWQMGRAGAALGAALCITLGGCGGGDAGADSLALGGDTMGAMNDSGAMTGAGAANMGAMTDEQIMSHVGGANGIEIAAGEIARDKATNADVKQFARDMVNDHQRLQAEADSLATRLNVVPNPPDPDSLTQALNEARDRLTSEAAGPAFDRMYMEMQVQAHENTLNMLNQASAATQNAEIRTMLQGAIPTIQQHLDRARQILNGLGTTTG